MGGFAEQGLAHRVDADQFAPKRHQVEVGLEDLVFAPLALERLHRQGLAQLLHQAAASGATLEVIVEQTGQLHRDGRRTAGLLVPQIGPGSGRDSLPVDAAVLVEALVFAVQQRGAERGRHIGQRHPLPAPHRGVGAQPVQQLAPAVQDQRVRGLPAGLGLVKRDGGGGGEGGGAERSQQRRDGDGPATAATSRCKPHFASSTRSRALGASPKISGAYMASTRDGGNEKSPALLSRIVYSILTTPLGR